MHAPPTANKDLKTKESEQFQVFLFYYLAPKMRQMVERQPAKFWIWAKVSAIHG